MAIMYLLEKIETAKYLEVKIHTKVELELELELQQRPSDEGG